MAERWPELRTLELLVAVAETGSLNAAARSLGMAQPNASRMLAALEHQLGAGLVRRSPRGSAATAEGALVIAHAREVLAAVRGLLESVGTRRTERENALAIGSSLTITEYLLPAWLAQLHAELPQVRPRLHAMNSAQVFAALDASDCGLGLVETPVVPRRFARRLVHVDRLTVVVCPRHEWATAGEPLTAARLAATPLLTREPGSGTRTALERALGGLGMAQPLQELSSNAAVLAGACAGMGPAALSRLVVAGALAAGSLVEVPVPDVDLTRRFHAVWPRNRRPDASAVALVRIAAGALGG